MSVALVALAAAIGGGTYLYAKSKKASNGTAAVAGVATGAGAAATAALVGVLLPYLIVAGIIGLPAAGLYYIGKARGERKALGPARDDY